MRYLCLDSSAGTVVSLVDLAHPETPAISASNVDARRHAEHLIPLVQQVYRQGGWENLAAADLAGVVVGTGPAPFTGLRAGLVTARMQAAVLGIPVYGVCSLDILARQAFDVFRAGAEAEGAPDGAAEAADGAAEAVDEANTVPDGANTAVERVVWVVTDARRREIHAACYRECGVDDVERLAGPQVLAPAEIWELAPDLPRPAEPGSAPTSAVVLGNGCDRYPGAPAPTPGFSAEVTPEVGARIVADRLRRQAAGDTVELGTEPLYLRRPDIHPGGPPKRVVTS